MIIHYTKHAEEKFFILQRHGRQILKEDITALIKIPENIDKRDEYTVISGTVSPEDESWEVIYKKEGTAIRVLTFYPVKAKEKE